MAIWVSIFLTLTLPAPAPAQGEGVIEGQVMNGTGEAAQASVVGLDVDLYELVDGSASLLDTTTSDRQGRFTFQGLNTGFDRAYRIQLEYHGVVYSTESTFPRGESLIRIVTTVYETTTRDSGLIVDQHEVVVDFGADALTVRELCVLRNRSDTIYVGEDNTTARFPLPDGAADLTIGEPEVEAHFVDTEEGFANVRPIMPGRNQVHYSYRVPYDGGELTLSRRIAYPTAKLDVKIAAVGVHVESAQLEYQGLSAGSKTAYLHFQGRDLPASDQIDVIFAGVPREISAFGGPTAETTLPFERYAPLVVWLMVVVGAALPFAQLRLGRRRARRAAVTGRSPRAGIGQTGGSGTERDELLQVVADLDDAYADGLLHEESYSQLRGRMRERLRELWSG